MKLFLVKKNFSQGNQLAINKSEFLIYRKSVITFYRNVFLDRLDNKDDNF